MRKFLAVFAAIGAMYFYSHARSSINEATKEFPKLDHNCPCYVQGVGKRWGMTSETYARLENLARKQVETTGRTWSGLRPEEKEGFLAGLAEELDKKEPFRILTDSEVR